MQVTRAAIEAKRSLTIFVAMLDRFIRVSVKSAINVLLPSFAALFGVLVEDGARVGTAP